MGANMQTGQIYREILLGIFNDYARNRLPIWVSDGLLEEGYAERDESGTLRLTTEGAAFSQAMKAGDDRSIVSA